MELCSLQQISGLKCLITFFSWLIQRVIFPTLLEISTSIKIFLKTLVRFFTANKSILELKFDEKRQCTCFWTSIRHSRCCHDVCYLFTESTLMHQSVPSINIAFSRDKLLVSSNFNESIILDHFNP